MNITPITNFTGQYRFLSNFDTAPFKLRNFMFASGEHAFVYGKLAFLKDPSERLYCEEVVFETPRCDHVRAFGKNIDIDTVEWDKYSAQWMRELVHAKFGYVSNYAGMLINTGAAMLVEGNTWGDKTWGRVNEGGTWKGLNLLGSILMEERGYWLHHEFGGKQ